MPLRNGFPYTSKSPIDRFFWHDMLSEDMLCRICLPLNDQCYHDIETNQLICIVNQLASFYRDIGH